MSKLACPITFSPVRCNCRGPKKESSTSQRPAEWVAGGRHLPHAASPSTVKQTTPVASDAPPAGPAGLVSNGCCCQRLEAGGGACSGCRQLQLTAVTCSSRKDFEACGRRRRVSVQHVNSNMKPLIVSAGFFLSTFYGATGQKGEL
jgi:hypothetical protein